MLTDIVVQNVASFRIDPAVLARPHRRTVLVTSPTQHQKLLKRNRADVFDRVIVHEDFSPSGIARCVTAVRDALPPGDRDGVRLLCHDEYALGAVAEARLLAGVPGDRPEQVAPFVDKLAMKAALADAGVRLPKHREWSAADYHRDPGRYAAGLGDDLGWPVFVKPLDESGSVGTAVLRDAAALHAWAREAGERRFELDEYLDGDLFHVDTTVRDGEILHAKANRYLHPCYDYLKGRLCASWTLPDDRPEAEALKEFNRRVLEAFRDKPRDGVFHHEVFRRPDGELVFLEIASRAPAALVPSTHRIAWGVDIEESHFRLQRGERPLAPEATGLHAAWAYFPKRAGTVVDLRTARLRSDHHWQWNVETGRTTEAPRDIRDFSAAVLLWNSDHDALLEDLRTLDAHRAVLTA
ncbi:acetyl-CoA carboxylase biotin carboxylase subunit family protein [Streptomyces sp. NPDC001744]|uniref:ATP-grasp domain-containing protein n=1 Tax=Streptomyces sp. NPDC001744 TaxID=3364606 RepID=UPI0036AA25C5